MPDIETIHPPADRLAAYALGEMDGPEMDEIEQHLSSSDSCCRVINVLRYHSSDDPKLSRRGYRTALPP